MQKEYNIRDTENIFDVVLNTVGSLDATYALISANPVLADVNIDFSLTDHLNVFFEPVIEDRETIRDPKTKPVIEGKKMAYSGQSVFDLVLQTYGDLNKTILLLNENSLDINTPPPSGKEINFNAALVDDLFIYRMLAEKKIIFNTDDLFEALPGEPGEPEEPVIKGSFSFEFSLEFK